MPRISFLRALRPVRLRPRLGRRFHTIGPYHAIVDTHFGGVLSFDTRNIDTMPGPVRTGWTEPWNDVLLRALLRPGMTYVNAGANYGYFTVLGGLRVGNHGKVVAFEANPYNFVHLMRSAYWSGTIGQTTLVNRAVGDVDDADVTFSFDPQYSGGGNALWMAEPVPGATPDTCTWNAANLPKLLDDHGRWVVGRGLMVDFKTKSITMDSALEGVADTVDVLQMDIEGGEARAILGAKRTIERSADLRIIMEWWGGHHKRPDLHDTIRPMWDYLTGEKFRCYQIVERKLRRIRLPARIFPGLPGLRPVKTWEDFLELPLGEVFWERG